MVSELLGNQIIRYQSVIVNISFRLGRSVKNPPEDRDLRTASKQLVWAESVWEHHANSEVGILWLGE